MLEVHRLTKHYPTPTGPLAVLSEIDLSLAEGESLSIVGPSGSGKSTLLYILGTLEPPTSGTILFDGTNPFELGGKKLAAFRNRQVGFVFQDSHLLPQCTVLENVLLPTLVSPEDKTELRRRALGLLEQVGLGQRIRHRPQELSGGEKQRVALARALVRQPRLILCDEPTGNLDHESTERIAAILFELHRRHRTILLTVTHNLDLAARFSRQYRLSDAHLYPV